MNTIYKDGKEICQCIQYDGENIKEVGDFLKEHKIYWRGTRGGPYIVYCTHDESILHKTDWLLKRQNDFVVMTDQNFRDTYNDMAILPPLCTDFTNAGLNISGEGINWKAGQTIGKIIDPLKEKFQVSNLKPLVIPPALTFKPASLLSREDEFVLTITTAFIKTGTNHVQIGEMAGSLAREMMAIATKLKENNHE